MSNGVIYKEYSKNEKVGDADATYVSIAASCPKTCALKKDGSCYAMLGNVGIHVHRIDKEAEDFSTLDIARAEAAAIDACYKSGEVPNRDLRLHVSGNSRAIAGSRIINSAVGRWKKRGGNDCWSYTHCYSNVTRDIWSNVSILASVDDVSQVALAKDNGYAPAIVVAQHLDNRAYKLPNSEIKWIPCPAQTKDNVTCVDCRLCFDSDRLFKKNLGISFEAHGVKKGQIKRRLTVIK